MDTAEISEEIIASAAQGDAESFEKIYRAHCGFVYRVSLRMVSNLTDAEEITQDVFLRVFGHLKHFRFESSLRTWIYRITVNMTLNYRKKRTRQRQQVTAIYENTQAEQSLVNPNFGETEDQQARVDRLLNMLNPDQKMCMVLRVIEGMSYEQIAETLSININTVRTRLKRAREKLMSLKYEVVGDEV